MLGVQRELPTTGHVSHPFALSARLHPISQDLHFLPHPLALSLTQTAERFEPTNMREWRNYALAALLLLHDERPLRRGWRVEVMEKVGVYACQENSVDTGCELGTSAAPSSREGGVELAARGSLIWPPCLIMCKKLKARGAERRGKVHSLTRNQEVGGFADAASDEGTQLLPLPPPRESY